MKQSITKEQLDELSEKQEKVLEKIRIEKDKTCPPSYFWTIGRMIESLGEDLKEIHRHLKVDHWVKKKGGNWTVTLRTEDKNKKKSYWAKELVDALFLACKDKLEI